MADRLLEHDARLCGVASPAAAGACADRAEQVRRGGEVDRPAAGRSPLAGAATRSASRLAGGIERHIADPGSERVEHALVEIGCGDVLAAGLLDHGRGSRRGRESRARGRHDPAAVRHLAVAEPIVERRHQLAQRQVAGPAEDDEIGSGTGMILAVTGFASLLSASARICRKFSGSASDFGEFP